MLEHYNTLVAQLETDIKDALGYTTETVFFGTQRTGRPVPHTNVVLQSINRVPDGGRGVRMEWVFLITPRFRRNEATEEAEELFTMEQADALTQKLAPFDEDTVPAAAPRYAGIGVLRKVTSFTPGAEEDSDNYIQFTLQFECNTHVYQ